MGPTLIWLVAVAATLVVLPALVVGCAIWRKVRNIRSGPLALRVCLERGTSRASHPSLNLHVNFKAFTD